MIEVAMFVSLAFKGGVPVSHGRGMQRQMFFGIAGSFFILSILGSTWFFVYITSTPHVPSYPGDVLACELVSTSR